MATEPKILEALIGMLTLRLLTTSTLWCSIIKGYSPIILMHVATYTIPLLELPDSSPHLQKLCLVDRQVT